MTRRQRRKRARSELVKTLRVLKPSGHHGDDDVVDRSVIGWRPSSGSSWRPIQPPSFDPDRPAAAVGQPCWDRRADDSRHVRSDRLTVAETPTGRTGERVLIGSIHCRLTIPPIRSSTCVPGPTTGRQTVTADTSRRFPDRPGTCPWRTVWQPSADDAAGVASRHADRPATYTHRTSCTMQVNVR
jgi:hypothetical protein